METETDETQDQQIESAWYFVARFQMPLSYKDAMAKLRAELERNPQLSQEAQERCLTDDARKMMAKTYERRADLIRKTLAWASQNAAELGVECGREIGDGEAELSRDLFAECSNLERSMEREREAQLDREQRAAHQAMRDRGEFPPLDEHEHDTAWSDSREPMARFTVPDEDWPHLEHWDSATRSLADLAERATSAEAEAEKQRAPSGRGANKGNKAKRAEETHQRAQELRAAVRWAEAGGAQRYPLPAGINADDTCCADIQRAEAGQRGLARRFLVKTDHGAVEVRIDASDFLYAQDSHEYSFGGVEIELRGESISETSYRSCGHQYDFEEVSRDPYAAAVAMVQQAQEAQAAPKKKGRSRPVIEQEEPEDHDEPADEGEDDEAEEQRGAPMAAQTSLF